MNLNEELDRCTFKASEFAAIMPQKPVCYFNDAARIAEGYAKEKAFILFQDLWWKNADPSIIPTDIDVSDEIKEDFKKWWEENK